MKHYSTSFEKRLGIAMSDLKLSFWFLCLIFTANITSAQTIQLNIPCQCREFPAASQGNATTLDNGQFIDTIQVNSGNGEVWYIAEANGFFDVASPQPPFTPLSYMTGAAGATFTESPAGVYTLPGVHVDALGYSISVTNGTDTLEIANTCAYPNPVITSEIRNGYCQNSDPITLTANAGTSTGTGVFDVLAEDMMTAVQSDISVFDPASLALGTYFLRYTFDEDDAAVLPCMNCNPGCVQAIFAEIDIVEEPFSLACNDEINVVLSVDCDTEILPDMLLEGDQPSYEIFDVNVKFNGQNLGNTVGAAQIGLDLIGEVTDFCTGNSCWTALTVSDGAPPMLACPTAPIQIVCTDNPDNVLPPVAVDGCEGLVDTDLIADTFETFNCGDANGVLRRIFRTYTAEDSFGNTSPNCVQIIEVLKIDLDEVVLPPHLDDNPVPALECPTTDTNPDVTGFPTINGLPINGNDFCTISATFMDQNLTGCGGSRKILRYWTIYDYCEPTAPDVNPIYYTQTIKINDTTPPTIVAPADITVSAFNADCTGNVNLPPAMVTDACSDFTVSTISPQGFMASNGGLLTNLPEGIYFIVYTALDDCGNQMSDQMMVTVLDNVAPTLVCDELSTATLVQTGEAVVPAETLDDGSFDNCTGVSFLIGLVGGPYNENIIFDCDDVGQTITVELQVSDENGNSNTCEIQVMVENNQTPTISCPASLTIDCSEDSSTANTGIATASSNCDLAPISNTDITTNLNPCGLGFIIREFSVTDAAGNNMTCQQTITIENGDPLLESQVSFPENYAVTDCTSSADLLPQNLPTTPINFSEPIINNNSCINVAFSFSDEIFDVNQNGAVCFKINRTWAIMDWCNNGAVTFSNTQVIEVTDNTAPVITCPEDITIDVSNGTCDTTLFLQSPMIDDCSDDINLVVLSSFGIGFGPFTNVMPDVYNVTYFVDDNCGNQANCAMTIKVEETVPPSITCGDTLVVAIGNDGTVTINPTDFDGVIFSDNCTAVEDIELSFTPNVGDSTLVFDCNDALSGLNVSLNIYAIDEEGNNSFCLSQVDLDGNVGACDDPFVAVTGMIFNEEDFPINEVTMSVTGTTNPTMTTGTDGVFEFMDLPVGGDFSVVPTKDINIVNGVTSLDLSIISRHILNIQLIDSPYKMIAADVNNNGIISTTDVVAARKVILQMSTTFPNDNPSWRFVAADYEFINPSNPLNEDFPEVVNFNNLTEPMMADFIGIKIGDVNCSSNPLFLLAADDRNGEVFPLMIENRVVEAGETFTVDFNIENRQAPRSLQFALKFSENLEFISLNEGWIQSENLGTNELTTNVLKTAWYGNNADLTAPVLSLTFNAKAETRLSDAFMIDETQMKSEAASGENTYTIQAVDLAFSEGEMVTDTWVLHQNAPNPFQNTTRIGVELGEATNATLRITDVFGKKVYQTKQAMSIGINYFEIQAAELPVSGVYLYEVETAFGIKSSKMVFVKGA